MLYRIKAFLRVYMTIHLLRVVCSFVAKSCGRDVYSASSRQGRTTTRTLLSSTSTSTSSNDGCEKTIGEGAFSSEMEVKKSRFIGYARHVKTWDDAQAYIDQVKKEHPKARHWCYGFRSGSNPVHERCSDDGEPTGTAGAPILGAIRGEELSDTVCLVVRYFGGIKLGAGGLIRAYGGAARQVLRESPVEVLIPMNSVRVKVSSMHLGSLYELVGKYDACTSNEDYLIDGSVEITITLETTQMNNFCTGLNDSTRGEATIDLEAKTSAD